MQALLRTVLDARSDRWTAVLCGRLGYELEEAESFLPPAMDAVLSIVQERAGEPQSPQPGALLAAVDVASVAPRAGLGEGRTREGLETLVFVMHAAVEEALAADAAPVGNAPAFESDPVGQ